MVDGGWRVDRENSWTIDSPARVLVLVDQRVIAELVKLTLNHGVFLARDTPDVGQALTVLAEWRPHLAILDMDSGGTRLLAQIGRSGPGGGARTPVLALTRRGDLETKLAAFEQGVDDIMTIPFSPEELLARMLALARRSYGEAAAFKPVLRLGELEIDILRRRVRAGSSEVPLTGLEQALLYLLAANAGQVLSRDEILDTLWGTDYVAESNVVDRHIRSLRAKLQNDWHRPRYIVSVPGRGYRFVPVSADQGGMPESDAPAHGSRGARARAPA